MGIAGLLIDLPGSETIKEVSTNDEIERSAYDFVGLNFIKKRK